MSYDTQPLKTTTGSGRKEPIPQYFNPVTNQYEVVQGKEGASYVTPKGISDFLTGAVTVTGTAVELKAGTSAMAGRKQLILYPPSAGTIYWGVSGVTAANGAPLTANSDPIVFDLYNDIVKVYAVSDGTNREVRVVESK